MKLYPQYKHEILQDPETGLWQADIFELRDGEWLDLGLPYVYGRPTRSEAEQSYVYWLEVEYGWIAQMIKEWG